MTNVNANLIEKVISPSKKAKGDIIALKASSHLKQSPIRQTFEKGEGLFCLKPVFVPRPFNRPGKRLRLHPDDYYAFGTKRGAIKERWFSSVIRADNGPLASENEGMSYVVGIDGEFSLADAVGELGKQLVGNELFSKYGTWPMYSKFFDYEEPLFHHLHLTNEAAARVGRVGKPEGYYFPVQLNNYMGNFPHTYFGFSPETTKQQVLERLRQYEKKDNRITDLSRAYRLQLGTGWFTPPGVVHAPGSVLTYEPQWNSDVYSVYENIVAGETYPFDFLVDDCPAAQKKDFDYILSLMDWEKNVDPDYKLKYFRPSITCANSNDQYIEKWILYANDYVAAKELTILPRQTVLIKDPVAYGCIIIQGHGKFGVYDAEAAIMLRFGQQSADEYFVSEQAAVQGVRIQNVSHTEPMVILKHFGPNHPEVPKVVPGNC